MSANLTDWLLRECGPGLRYRTLTDLIGVPGDDPEVFESMHPDGYWEKSGRGSGVEYAHAHTAHFVLPYLAELGVDRSEPRFARAAERYLSLEPSDLRGTQSCPYAHNLRTLVRAGYGDGPRVRQRIEVLLASSRWDGGYESAQPGGPARRAAFAVLLRRSLRSPSCRSCETRHAVL